MPSPRYPSHAELLDSRFPAVRLVVFGLLVLTFAFKTRAHPMLQNALDVVIEPHRIIIEAKVSPEQIALIEAASGARPAAEQWPGLIQKHAVYVRSHLQVKADGVLVVPGTAMPIGLPSNTSPTALVSYRIEFPLQAAPRAVLLDQDFLREVEGWSATCVVRVRQSTQATFETGLLTAGKAATFDCIWPESAGATATSNPANDRRIDEPIPTTVRVGATIRAYLRHGIMHILTGYDHLLFVSALVLAATSIWDLVKVVSAFTLAHTLTLTLSVFNIVNLGERIVEPMIAASIVFVAPQNVFWPERSRGWTRLAIAFGFGLFHGLGFAGGLKEAMSGMPGLAIWAALGAFSLGVEMGHQVVVIPLYSLLYAAKHGKADVPRMALAVRVRQMCSIAICLAGFYFLAQAVR